MSCNQIAKGLDRLEKGCINQKKTQLQSFSSQNDLQKENKDQNIMNTNTKKQIENNEQSLPNDKANQLKSKLQLLRESRIQSEEQRQRKNWDNINPQIIQKLEDLEDHKSYIKSEQDEVKNNKKQILFKQRHQLINTTDVMQQKVEKIIDNEKDKLQNVFDDQLNQTRQTLTPSNSFYTNSRLNRSSSLDVSQYSFYNSSYLNNNYQQKSLSNIQNQSLNISGNSQGLPNFQSSNSMQQKWDGNSLNPSTNNSSKNQSRKAYSSLNSRQQNSQQTKQNILLNSNELNQQNVNVSFEQINVKSNKNKSIRDNYQTGNNDSSNNNNVLNLSSLNSLSQQNTNQIEQVSSLNDTKKLDAQSLNLNSLQENNHSQTCRQNSFQESLLELFRKDNKKQQQKHNQQSQKDKQYVKNNNQDNPTQFTNFMQESFALNQQNNESGDGFKTCQRSDSLEQKTLPRRIAFLQQQGGPASFLNENNSLLGNQPLSSYQLRQKQQSNNNITINRNQNNSETIEHDEAYWGTTTNGTTISFNEDQNHSKQSAEHINFTTLHNKSDNSVYVVDERKKSDGNLMKIMEKSFNDAFQNYKVGNQALFGSSEGYESSVGSQYLQQKEDFINNKRKENLFNQSQSLIGNQLQISCCPHCKKNLPLFEDFSSDQLQNSQNSNTQSKNQNQIQKQENEKNYQPFKNLNTFGSIHEMNFKSSLLNEDSNEKNQSIQVDSLLTQIKEKQIRVSLDEGEYLNKKRIQELEYVIGQLYKEIEIKDTNLEWLRKQRVNMSQINISKKGKQKLNQVPILTSKQNHKLSFCYISENKRLRNKVKRLETQNERLLKDKLNQEGLLQEYEMQLDQLFESIFQNEKELKQLKKQQKKSNKTFELMIQSEERVNHNFEEFKDKLESILTGYSSQLGKFNENEQYFSQISKENSLLKQERDELLKLLQLNSK